MKGPALILVLLCLSMTFMFCGEMSALANVSYRQSLMRSRKLNNFYRAESALSTKMWWLYEDIRNNANRNIDVAKDIDEAEQRFLADGVWTRDDEDLGFQVSWKLDDASQGFDLSGTLKSADLNNLKRIWLNEENNRNEEILYFFEQLRFYTRKNIAEKSEEYGDFDLPREAPMQYREEIFWIPNVDLVQNELSSDEVQGDFDLTQLIRPISPQGVKMSKRQKSNFYSASVEEVILRARLDENQLIDLLEAKRLWASEGRPIKESMPNLYSRLIRHFSFKESGVYRISVKVTESDGSLPVFQEATLQISSKGPRKLGSFKGLAYWERSNY